eukprot:SAG31_NODE_4793_length_2953_cov_14.309741_3_plen_67_part_00
MILKNQGSLRDAIEYCKQAADLQPAYGDVKEALAVLYTDLGTSLKLAGLVDSAIASYEAGIKADPT